MDVKEFFRKMVAHKASDLFLRVNATPHIRADGQLHVLEPKTLTKDDLLAITDFLLENEERKQFYRQNKDIDFIFHDSAIGRFRINIFTQRGTPSIVARHVSDLVKTFEELNLPIELLRQFCEEARGLILICGPAGSGKSTTIASMINYINDNKAKHIVTIEDPVEFLFKDKQSIINQRELGIDVASYPSALRHVTQQSPDIIYIGTIRDSDTMRAAISSAELGTLVFSTFHTVNAIQTIERIVNFFPPYQHNEVRMQLSLLLKGVLSLRLVPRADGRGRIPAYESMVVTPTVARLIRENNITQIQSYIDEGQLFGMQSFKQSLVKLVRQKLVDAGEARRLADSRDDFDLELKGVRRYTV